MTTAPRAHPEVLPGADDLIARFVRELELVGGHAAISNSEADAAEQLSALAHAENVRSVAMGRGITIDLDAFVPPLAHAGIEIIRADQVADSDRAAIRERIARCDLGLAEADYGIASTGTLAVAADAARPGALTLLPPISVVILRADRVVSDLAALFARLGPQGVAERRLTLITGPSRTADIEKRIVMGVHGPRALQVILIRSHDE
jgi:L-lactate utilization protein LutC